MAPYFLESVSRFTLGIDEHIRGGAVGVSGDQNPVTLAIFFSYPQRVMIANISSVPQQSKVD